MKHEFPPYDKAEQLPLGHFPSVMQCFIFRNWEMIPPEKLADVLGCTADRVLELADGMGLVVPPHVSSDWITKGYITIIRANWHICTYAQIARLLGWSEEKLAFILREDDFLSVKLGNSKPNCPPVAFRELTASELQATARIRETVTKVRASLPPRKAPPFDFRPRFRTYVTGDPPVLEKRRFEERIIYSYCALYGDTFSDRKLLDESFPDELLAAYRSLGITGIWTQAVLYMLVPPLFDPDSSEGWKKRIEGMRYLVEKLGKYGLKLFLYLNEPRSMPDEFFIKHPEIKGRSGGKGYSCLCVSTKPVRDYLYHGAYTLASSVPGLGGFITITASENLTNCYSHSVLGTCECPRCSKRMPAEVIADVNRCLYEGARAADPDFRFIAWNWSWQTRQPDMNRAAADLMPEGIGIMCVSEEKVKKNVGGTLTSVVDYSISVEGPGEYALDTWATARKTGHKAYAKLQLGCTWEMAAVPCLPAFEKIWRHLTAITSKDAADGIMLGWTLGGFPSPTLRLARCFYEKGIIPGLEEAYAVMFPGCDPKKLAPAFHLLSEALDEFPFHLAVAYFAPQLYGPSNLLYDVPTGRFATMVGFPYDDLDKWRGIYPEDTFISQLKKLSEGWEAGTSALEAASTGCSSAALEDVLRWSRVCACHFRATYNQSVFVKRRREGIIDTDIIKNEEELARRMLVLSGEDPTVGYESSNHYFFTRAALLEKIINCRFLLEKYV